MFNSSTSAYFTRPISHINSKFLVRYVSKDVFNLANLNFFMDDDLLDYSAIYCLPSLYAFRIFFKTAIWRHQIKLYSKFFVSTKYLEKKYQCYSPKLLQPIVSEDLLFRKWNKARMEKANQTIRICYHGTWSHRDDMKWLSPVIAEVQRCCRNTVFEVIGDHRVARIFRGIPRVTVLPTMLWPDYVKHTQTVRQDIGLAPLRDTLFNRGRGPIKFFDYARAGAVGVYSAGPAFSDFVSHEIDGFVLENDQSLWIERIIELVNSTALREKMYAAAWDKVLDNSPASPKIQAYLKELEDALI